MPDWYFLKPTATRNVVRDPAAAGPDPSSTWTVINGGTMTVNAANCLFGNKSYYFVGAAAGDGVRFLLDGPLSNNHHVVTMYAKASSAWEWSLDNTNWHEPSVHLSVGQWVRYYHKFSYSEANGSSELRIRQKDAAALYAYMDGLQVEENPGSDYGTFFLCEGEQPGCYWESTPFFGSSIREASVRSGGLLTPFTDFNFLVGQVAGAGTTPVNINIADYADLPGGELTGVERGTKKINLTGPFMGDEGGTFHRGRGELLVHLLPDNYPKVDGKYQPLILVYTGADDMKWIAVHYAGGLEGSWDHTVQNIKCHEPTTIRFVAPDPVWRHIGNYMVNIDDAAYGEVDVFHAASKQDDAWGDMGLTSIATWNAWNAGVYTPWNNRVVFAGDFTNLNGIADADYIACYIPSTKSWYALDGAIPTPDNIIYGMLTVPGDLLYVVGWSTTQAKRFMEWDPYGGGGSGYWNNVAGGFNGIGRCLAYHDLKMYVGGDFTILDPGGSSVAANRVAEYDMPVLAPGRAMGTGFNTGCYTLAVGLDGTVYAGGAFTADGGSGTIPLNHAAQWDGSAWSQLGNGFDDNVLAMVVGPTGLLYAGGDFTQAGDVETNHIACWNGAGWTEVGGGTNGKVRGINFDKDGNLWVWGDFTQVGGRDVSNGLAVWNGSTWLTPLTRFHTSTTTAVHVVVHNPRTGDVYIGHDSYGYMKCPVPVSIPDIGTAKAYPRFIFQCNGEEDVNQILGIENHLTGGLLNLDRIVHPGERIWLDVAPGVQSLVSRERGRLTTGIVPGADLDDQAFLPQEQKVSIWTDRLSASIPPDFSIWIEWEAAWDSVDS